MILTPSLQMLVRSLNEVDHVVFGLPHISKQKFEVNVVLTEATCGLRGRFVDSQEGARQDSGSSGYPVLFVSTSCVACARTDDLLNDCQFILLFSVIHTPAGSWLQMPEAKPNANALSPEELGPLENLFIEVTRLPGVPARVNSFFALLECPIEPLKEVASMMLNCKVPSCLLMSLDSNPRLRRCGRSRFNSDKIMTTLYCVGRRIVYRSRWAILFNAGQPSVRCESLPRLSRPRPRSGWVCVRS